MKIYVVMGTTGEYSDREEWPVKASTRESSARELVEKASARAREIYVSYKDPRFSGDIPKNEFDPDMQMFYTGTSYYIMEVDLDVEGEAA